jgi:hypothetical protein
VEGDEGGEGGGGRRRCGIDRRSGVWRVVIVDSSCSESTCVKGLLNGLFTVLHFGFTECLLKLDSKSFVGYFVQARVVLGGTEIRPRGPFSRLCCAKTVAVPELLEMRACIVVDPTPRCWKEAQNGDLGKVQAMGSSR